MRHRAQAVHLSQEEEHAGHRLLLSLTTRHNMFGVEFCSASQSAGRLPPPNRLKTIRALPPRMRSHGDHDIDNALLLSCCSVGRNRGARTSPLKHPSVFSPDAGPAIKLLRSCQGSADSLPRQCRPAAARYVGHSLRASCAQHPEPNWNSAPLRRTSSFVRVQGWLSSRRTTLQMPRPD